MSWSCQPYQPLPISTGASGLDRCGNVVAYAAPGVVQAPVGWCCWPIQYQGGWIYGPFCPPGWSGGAPPPVVSPYGGWPAADWTTVVRGGAALANWMIGVRRGGAPARRAA